MCKRGKVLSSEADHRWQYGACALHAGSRRLQIHPQIICVLLVLTAFPLHQKVQEHASMLRHTYIAARLFIIEVVWVYCAVRAEYLNMLEIYCRHSNGKSLASEVQSAVFNLRDVSCSAAPPPTATRHLPAATPFTLSGPRINGLRAARGVTTVV